MKLAPPTVGPILGYTSREQARIWIRGEYQRTPDDGYRRCFGVARLRRQTEPQQWSVPKFVKLEPHFDFTGVFVFRGLDENCVYEYQAGWFFSETELKYLVEDLPVDWHIDWGSLGPPIAFRTGVSSSQESRSYAVGHPFHRQLRAAGCRCLRRQRGVLRAQGKKAGTSGPSRILTTRGNPRDAASTCSRHAA
jgi:alkaline phosphatase D